MKNAVKVLIFVLVTVALVAGGFIFLFNYDGSDFEYVDASKADSIEITGYYGTDKDIVIPEKIKGKTVVAIGESAFSSPYITSVEIPDTVTTIRTKAFFQCSELKTVRMSESIESIGDSAFFLCPKLESILLPPSLKNLEGGAFYGCENLEFEIPEGSAFEYVDGVLYSDNKSCVYMVSENVDLNTFEFPNTVRSFSPYSLACHNELINFTIPSGVTDIPESMLLSCENLETIIIPDTVKTIGEMAFFGCMKLKSITVPASVGEIGKGNFPVKDQDEIPDFVLKVYDNSSAFFYAKENNINFEIIG